METPTECEREEGHGVCAVANGLACHQGVADCVQNTARAQEHIIGVEDGGIDVRGQDVKATHNCELKSEKRSVDATYAVEGSLTYTVRGGAYVGTRLSSAYG